MPRLVISTVGTSLLTNQVDRDFDPNNWLERLQKTANYTIEEINKYHEDVSQIIEDLKQRAEEKLYGAEADVQEIREASAELNGIYGLYNEQLAQGISDTHLLIATDTAQARITAEIVESFLKSQGLANTSTCIQPGLSTASSNTFTEGIAKLIPSIQETIFSCKKSQYQIYFNLVGGFKALQGYFNTIGMFYADELIYVFEGTNEVIKIPRLPITIARSEVEPYKVQLAMMDVGEILTSWEEAKKVPKEWVIIDGQEMTLSTWGQLIWNQCNDDLLSRNDLLDFPKSKLDYRDSLKDDYQRIQNPQERIQLQKEIAKVACALINHKDGISVLKEGRGGVKLRRYTGTDIEHFNITDSLRVSCKLIEGRLWLRYYGTHNHVQRSEGIKGK
jgi:putative CRISPR-associated protein (TIGR02619 family)